MAIAMAVKLEIDPDQAAAGCRNWVVSSSGAIGVPVVLEQKTTILWKCLYLLMSL
jgi:hypothetical protein